MVELSDHFHLQQGRKLQKSNCLDMSSSDPSDTVVIERAVMGVSEAMQS